MPILRVYRSGPSTVKPWGIIPFSRGGSAMAIARLAVLLALVCLALPAAASAQSSLVHSFQDVDHEGAIPVAGVIAVDSRLYGTTTLSWTPGSGTVFSMNPDGSDYRVL